MQIHGWQTEFTISARHDHLELMQSMSEIQTTTESVNAKLEENTELTRQVMKMMQAVCRLHHE